MRCRRVGERLGMTLIELLVVLVILALVASVVAFAPAAVERAPAGDVEAGIAAARREALRSGAPVTIDIVIDGHPHSVTALPDGSVIADSALDVDRLRGKAIPDRGAR